MKKIIYFLAATVFMLNSCQDDEFEKQTGTTQSGDGILFSTSLSEGLETRTVYDDEPTIDGNNEKYYRVSWVNGDEIAIYCPEASTAEGGKTLINYQITPNSKNPTISEKVESEGVGLKWGSADTHRFYGFYPASQVKGTEDGKIRGTVPTTQLVKEWNTEENEKGGITYYGVADTNFAYMWAYGTASRENIGESEAVNMTFHPWMTILEIEINGPEGDSKKIVTNINITATEGTQTMLAGDFICDMTSVENNPESNPKYESIGNEGTVSNNISIPCYADDNTFITLGANDKIIVRAFLLPIDDQNATNARNIKISVATMNEAALERTLGWTNYGEHSIKPHEVNKVSLPPLKDTGTNYWLSSLDPDIYLSELSLPGSKFSYLTSENNAAVPYQSATISTQFQDGVRAFIVQTDAKAIYSYSSSNRQYEYQSATLNVTGGNNATLENTVSDIKNALSTAKTNLENQNRTCQECAVIMVTYNTATATNSSGNRPSDITNNIGNYKIWIESVEHVLADLANNSDYKDYIYQEPITANTTLGDVAGKIIFKVNYNKDGNNNMANYATANGTCPALFSCWDGIMHTVDLLWGTASSTNSYDKLKWMYQEATHIGQGSGEGNETTKLSNIKTVFQNSIDTYLSNTAHDTWFMNDCGGIFWGTVSDAGSTYNGTYSNQGNGEARGVTQLTMWINSEVIPILQRRTANASLGLVFFNFADKQQNSGQKYQSDWLIQTIIDNNFKFNLRKK